MNKNKGIWTLLWSRSWDSPSLEFFIENWFWLASEEEIDFFWPQVLAHMQYNYIGFQVDAIEVEESQLKERILQKYRSDWGIVAVFETYKAVENESISRYNMILRLSKDLIFNSALVYRWFWDTLKTIFNN